MPALSTSPPPSATQGGPGPQGPPGQSAFTFSTSDVVNYDGKSNLTIPVQNVSWIAVGEPLFIPAVGTLQVTAIDTTNKILTLLPLKTDIGTYPHTIPSGTMVTANGFPGLNGSTGNTGLQGPPGPTGPQGPQGIAGSTGQTGATGPTGPQGPIGVQGAVGPQGTTGPVGPQGVQGPVGIKGDQGASGPQGNPGQQGIQGPVGAVGPAGPIGPQGPPGPAVTAQGLWNNTAVYAQGDLVTYNNLIYIGLRANQNAQPDIHPQDWAVYSSVGIQGPQGPPGATGPSGPTGPQGPQGIQGAAGPDGATGPPGAQGPQGAKGDPGPTGATGPPGSTGPAGAQGQQGVPGPAGQSVNWRGTWSSANAYNPYDGVVYNGSSYVAIAPSTNVPPPEAAHWQLIAQVGTTGATGATGPQGPAGPQGAASTVPGPQGPAGATGPPGPTAVSGDAGNTAMLGTDSRIYVPPDQLATITKIGALQKLSGNTTDFLDGTNAFQPLANAVQPTIWSARLRSFNAIGNLTFEVDQRNVGAALSYPAGTSGQFQCDRWTISKIAATAVISSQRVSGTNTNLPGTNYCITNSFLGLAVSTAQATLAAGDYVTLTQNVEGPRLRELVNDTHSVSLFINSVAARKFALSIRDAAGANSLVKLISVPAGLSLVQLPNLPLWAAGGTWSTAPGALGYTLSICLACGTTFTAPSVDTWLNGNFLGAPGQDNWLSSNVNSNINFHFVQHEPGPLCTTPIDCPFTANLDECLRYYWKTYDYFVLPGTANAAGAINVASIPNQDPVGYYPYKKKLAKGPTIIYYSSDGTANAVHDSYAGINRTVASVYSYSQDNAGYPHLTTQNSGNSVYSFQVTADTGW